jgi:hypothetical protein
VGLRKIIESLSQERTSLFSKKFTFLKGLILFYVLEVDSGPVTDNENGLWKSLWKEIILT